MAIDWNICGDMKKKVTAKIVADFIETFSPEAICLVVSVSYLGLYVMSGSPFIPSVTSSNEQSS